MKYYLRLLTFLLFFYLNFTSAQVTQEWVARYNGPGNGDDVFYSGVIDRSGNVYFTGYSYGTGTREDMLTVKYNPAGIQQWIVRYDSLTDYALSIGLDDSNNVYVGGNITNNQTYWAFVVIKYDPVGNRQWIQKYIGAQYSYLEAIAVDPTGNVYVVGSSSTDGTKEDMVTIKYNSSGETQWVRRYNGSANGDDWGSSVALDLAGNVYVTGSSEQNFYTYYAITIKYASDGTLIWIQQFSSGANRGDGRRTVQADNRGYVYVAGHANSSGNNSDYLTIKYDSSGTLLWARIYGGVGGLFDAAESVAFDDLGNVFVTGFCYQNGWTQYTTIKYNSGGVQQWVNIYTNGVADGGGFVCVDRRGDVYVTGFSINVSPDEDIATIKYNTIGQQLWVQRYNGPGSGYGGGSCILIDSLLNVYVGGSSTGVGTEQDATVIKYSQLIGVNPISNTIPSSFKLSQNYPNPFNPVTRIKFDIPAKTHGNASLRIYDILGREVVTLINEPLKPGTYEVEWDASNFPSGVYYYKLTVRQAGSSTGDFSETKKMVLLK